MIDASPAGLGAPGRASRPSSARALRSYANLTRELAITSFKLKYTGSALGYAWSLFKPAMIFAVNYAVFAQLLRAGNVTVNFPLQLLLGIVLWSFFSETVSVGLNCIAANGHIIRKTYFPRGILVLAASVSSFITFVINLSLVVIVAGALGRLDLQWHSLVMFALIAELYVLIVGLSLALAAFNVFYRDLAHLWEVASQLLFYGSAIVYPFVLIPMRYRKLIACNPIAQIVEDARHALISSDSTVPWTADILVGAAYVVPLAIVAIVFIVGGTVFTRLSPRFAEAL